MAKSRHFAGKLANTRMQIVAQNHVTSAAHSLQKIPSGFLRTRHIRNDFLNEIHECHSVKQDGYLEFRD